MLSLDDIEVLRTAYTELRDQYGAQNLPDYVMRLEEIIAAELTEHARTAIDSVQTMTAFVDAFGTSNVVDVDLDPNLFVDATGWLSVRPHRIDRVRGVRGLSLFGETRAPKKKENNYED